jgi:hypothetical protein
MNFRDVPSGHWAYGYVEWAYCRGLVSGYTCGAGCAEFRPDEATTRGQLVKMVVLASAFPLALPPGAPHFADVPPGNVFYVFAEVAQDRGIVAGYACGGTGEPCDAQNRPYLRPYSNVTRGQVAKILTLARAWPPIIPPSPTFADVPPDHPFYAFIETVALRRVAGGYDCGGPGEPCDPLGRPYFRWSASATRAQLAKMLFQAYAIAARGGGGLRYSIVVKPAATVFLQYSERVVI